jgi:branched-chain amino acid transport system ATP-binding protein
MLSVVDLSASYTKGAQVLRGVSFELGERSISAVVGTNGAGKTTLLRSIMGLAPHVSGSVKLRGKELLGLPTHQIVAQGVRLVPEGRGTFKSLSVDENLDLGGYGLPADELRRRKQREFDRFPILSDRRAQRAGMLSGGEQQMLAIARAMMGDPTLLLLDEPSQGLAPIIVDRIFALFETLREAGVDILLVEQDVGRALEVSDVGFILEKGEIRRRDSAKVLLDDPEIRASFLGLA